MLSDLAEKFEPYSIVVPENVAPMMSERAALVMWAEDALGWNVVFDEPGTPEPGRLDGVFIPSLPILDRGRVVREEITPKEGDQILVWGRQVAGQPIEIHGIGVNDQVVYYHDFAQRLAREQRRTENEVAARRRLLWLLADEMAAQYCALPPLFRERIDMLRAAQADFVEVGERDELAMLGDAVAVANYCTARAMNEQDRAVAAVRVEDAALEWFDRIAQPGPLVELYFQQVIDRRYDTPDEMGALLAATHVLLLHRQKMADDLAEKS